MGQPAAVMGDTIVGTCTVHVIPSPSGVAPAGKLPFAAPLTQGLAPTVFIDGKQAAVVGSSGVNSQAPHMGLHASDPFALAPAQIGRVVSGSGSVLFDGQPAAHSGCGVTMCAEAGQLTGTSTVLVGS